MRKTNDTTQLAKTCRKKNQQKTSCNNSYTITNPYNNEEIASYEYDTWKNVENKLDILKSGRGTQKRLSSAERAMILRTLSGLLEKHSEQLATLITTETGKTISDSRVEISRAIKTTIASSEEAKQISGETLSSDAYNPGPNRLGIVVWRPLGTILCITPFNFPINITMHKIGPAFAAGNTILFKPGPQNTASAQLLTQLCYQAGMSQAVLQMVIPNISDMARLIKHDHVDAVNFTGGTAAADAIAKAAGYKKMLLELGGNDPLILMPDGNIEAAVTAAINQRFATAGQRCTAAKRLFIHDSVYDCFRDALVETSRKLIVGDPALDNTFIGPVINSKAADTIITQIEEAVSKGATVALGNRRNGNIVYPTILENIPDDCCIMREEAFGPIMPLRRFSDLDEIIPIINNTPYGLQAGVFTNDHAVMMRLFDELDVGTLATNDGPGFRAEHFPFGGVKQSGIGREGVKYAIREMSFQKTLVL